jgi:hypothetical protein
MNVNENLNVVLQPLNASNYRLLRHPCPRYFTLSGQSHSKNDSIPSPWNEADGLTRPLSLHWPSIPLEQSDLTLIILFDLLPADCRTIDA